MSGKKQFNEEKAIEQSMKLFRMKGYAGTSMSDLEAATGLKKSSIYNAFDSKEGLYSRTLEHFHSKFTTRALGFLDGDDFFEVVHSLPDALFGGRDPSGQPMGCVGTLAAMEMSNQKSTAKPVLAESMDEFIGRFVARCQRAMDEGVLATTIPAEQLGSTMAAITRGAIVLGAATGRRQAGIDAYEGLIALIDSQRLDG